MRKSLVEQFQNHQRSQVGEKIRKLRIVDDEVFCVTVFSHIHDPIIQDSRNPGE